MIRIRHPLSLWMSGALKNINMKAELFVSRLMELTGVQIAEHIHCYAVFYITVIDLFQGSNCTSRLYKYNEQWLNSCF